MSWLLVRKLRFSAVAWLLTLLAMSSAVEAVETSSTLGPVTVEISLQPDAPKIGDEVTLEIVAKAQPQVEVLMPEFGEALDRYQILDFTPRQQLGEDGTSVWVQRYSLQPANSGVQSIPPILVEFVDRRPGQSAAPEGLDAYEILTDRLDFNVESVVPVGASTQLRPMLGELQPPAPLISGAAGISIGLVMAGLVALAILWFVSKRRAQAVRRINAYQYARVKLDAELARPLPESDSDVERYFVVVSDIVRRYLEDRFELRAPDLTTEEFLDLAGRSKDLTSDHQQLLQDFLRQADLVKFAAVKASAAEIKQAGELASRFLDDTQADAPDVELSDEMRDASHESTEGTRV